MSESTELDHFFSSKKRQDFRNAVLLAKLFRPDLSELTAYTVPGADLAKKKLAVNWVQRARAFFQPTTIETIISSWSNGIDMLAGGAIRQGTEIKNQALQKALSSEAFELVLTMIGDSFQHELYSVARNCLTEIHGLHDLLIELRSIVDQDFDRKLSLRQLAENPLLTSYSKSRRASLLRATIRFRIAVLSQNYDRAMEFAGTLREHEGPITNIDIMKANLQIVNIHLVQHDVEAARRELDRVNMLPVGSSDVLIFRQVEAVLLLLGMALDFGLRDEGSRALRLLSSLDLDDVSRVVGHARLARTCSLAVLFSTLAGLPTVGSWVIEATSKSVKKMPEIYHWLEVAVLAFSFVNNDWELMERHNARLKRFRISETSILLTKAVGRWFDGARSQTERRADLEKFKRQASTLPERERISFPLDAVIDLKLGQSWNVGGGNSFAAASSF